MATCSICGKAVREAERITYYGKCEDCWADPYTYFSDRGYSRFSILIPNWEVAQASDRHRRIYKTKEKEE